MDQTDLESLRLPEAWSIVKSEEGNPKVVIAIVDSGTEWEHVDLRANVWTTQEEIADNGIDDDGCLTTTIICVLEGAQRTQ